MIVFHATTYNTIGWVVQKKTKKKNVLVIFLSFPVDTDTAVALAGQLIAGHGLGVCLLRTRYVPSSVMLLFGGVGALSSLLGQPLSDLHRYRRGLWQLLPPGQPVHLCQNLCHPGTPHRRSTPHLIQCLILSQVTVFLCKHYLFKFYSECSWAQFPLAIPVGIFEQDTASLLINDVYLNLPQVSLDTICYIVELNGQ